MTYEREDLEIQYCFPAINSSCIKGKHSSHESNIMYVFFSLLSAWTVFLNLLVIISISHFKKLHTPTNLIILSLAVADMFVGLIVMPVDAIKLIETCGYFGDTFCDMFIIIMGLLISTSMCNLVLIAVDRYVALCHPLLYPQKITMTKTLISICLCWFFSSTYNIGYLVGGRYFEASQRSDECYGKCYLVISFSWIFNDLFFSFLLPCTLIITLKSERKSALTLGIIVTVYLLCWIPYYICSMSVIGYLITSATINGLTWVLYINSGLNPMVYVSFHPWFKNTVKFILTLKIFQPASCMVNILTEHQL
ncbi:trace amine-associated receptor 13c-like [Cyprinus carpio]|uniref:Trace amine-associated receptor 13c-like n=1 Tax=Cyprinus carpio TaxID=7962 RepID=A0A9Q9YK13_CYPCA|nr:trace amine-associated receptor 13c-like [Cyprinus carpio]